MKLGLLLVLATLPFCCHAGAGCQLLENVIEETISPNVTVFDYVDYLQPFIPNQFTESALEELKQCFLAQSGDTLANVQLMMDTIYSSIFCSLY
ncbi:mammaglobin-A-like [Fukomys damarensis]|uniref:mammaglobin-A-like n=1 Tax=Fukomys damarensis TaxID=885580 RepID=UPI00053FF27C|nr:mammaglobin-A-like [Fukomys damarensis]